MSKFTPSEAVNFLTSAENAGKNTLRFQGAEIGLFSMLVIFVMVDFSVERATKGWMAVHAAWAPGAAAAAALFVMFVMIESLVGQTVQGCMVWANRNGISLLMVL